MINIDNPIQILGIKKFSKKIHYISNLEELNICCIYNNCR